MSTSHQTGLVHDHLPTDDLVAYHAARARGGVGAIFLEATAVDPSGLLTSHTLGGFLPAIVPATGARRRRARARRPAASSSSSTAAASRSRPRRGRRGRAVGGPVAALHGRAARADRGRARALVDGYATAARHCREGGIDGIEVSMSHGYLIAQFFSPRSNRRADDYGADRLRFAAEVLEAVRAGAGPELAVGVRLAADELAPEGSTPPPAPRSPASCARPASSTSPRSCSATRRTSRRRAGSRRRRPAGGGDRGPLAAVRAAVDVPVIATTRVVDVAAPSGWSRPGAPTRSA